MKISGTATGPDSCAASGDKLNNWLLPSPPLVVAQFMPTPGKAPLFHFTEPAPMRQDGNSNARLESNPTGFLIAFLIAALIGWHFGRKGTR